MVLILPSILVTSKETVCLNKVLGLFLKIFECHLVFVVCLFDRSLAPNLTLHYLFMLLVCYHVINLLCIGN